MLTCLSRLIVFLVPSNLSNVSGSPGAMHNVVVIVQYPANTLDPGMVVHTFSVNTWEAEGGASM